MIIIFNTSIEDKIRFRVNRLNAIERDIRGAIEDLIVVRNTRVIKKIELLIIELKTMHNIIEIEKKELEKQLGKAGDNND